MIAHCINSFQTKNIVSKYDSARYKEFTNYKFSFQTCLHDTQLVFKHDCTICLQKCLQKYNYFPKMIAHCINSFQTWLQNVQIVSKLQIWFPNMFAQCKNIVFKLQIWFPNYKYSFQPYLHNMYKYSFQTCLACNPLLLKVRVIKRRK